MARPRSAETLARLHEAALDVFARQGFARTRVGDVARRIGIAHGTVYGYADGKEALFWLALRGHDLPELSALPIRRPGPAALKRAVEARAAALHALPELDAALARRDTPDGAAELQRILDAHYETQRRGARELALLERAGRDKPAIARVLGNHRQDLRDRMQRYLESRVSLGWIEAVPDAALAARAVLDAVAQCARRNEEDPDPVYRPEAVARETVIGWAARGLLVARPAERAGGGPLH